MLFLIISLLCYQWNWPYCCRASTLITNNWIIIIKNKQSANSFNQLQENCLLGGHPANYKGSTQSCVKLVCLKVLPRLLIKRCSHKNNTHAYLPNTYWKMNCTLHWRTSNSKNFAKSISKTFSRPMILNKYLKATFYIGITVRRCRFRFNNRPDALFIQIYSVIKLYMYSRRLLMMGKEVAQIM